MILVDAGPLIALADPDDQWCTTARAHLPKLMRVPLFLATPPLAEAYFALREPHQRRRLRAIVSQMGMRPVPEEAVGDLRERVFDWLERYEEHGPDFADACLAVFSGMNDRYRVWTYDREFETVWRRPDGSRISLAVPIPRK